MTVPLYDGFGDYDRFVNWDKRLAYELPFIEQQLADSGARRILDVACGTGRHAIALGQRGYDVTGADLSTGMIERAQANAAAVDSSVRFVTAGFGGLAARAGDDFDAVLCLGNSLPHVLTAEALRTALADFAAVLRPGGLLFVQTRNFDAVMAQGARWMAPQARREDGREWLFLRFYDFNADGTLTFNVVTLRRDDAGAWTQQVETTRLYPWPHAALSSAVEAAGFSLTVSYGDMTGTPFEPKSSVNLVTVARRDRVS